MTGGPKDVFLCHRCKYDVAGDVRSYVFNFKLPPITGEVDSKKLRVYYCATCTTNLARVSL